MIDSRLGKIALGILTVLPIISVLYSFSVLFPSINAQPQFIEPDQFNKIFSVHVLSSILALCLLIFYIVHLFRSETIANDKKALWAVVLFFGNLLAMIVYWCLYIWPEKPRTNTP